MLSILFFIFIAPKASAAPICSLIHSHHQLSQERLLSRIDALAKQELRLQTGEIQNRAQFTQNLNYYDKERTALMQAIPDFTHLYRERFEALLSEFTAEKKNQRAKLKEAQRKRSQKIEEANVMADEVRRISHSFPVVKAQISPDGKYIATLTQDSSLTVFEMDKEKPLQKFDSISSNSSLSFGSDSRFLSVTFEDKSMITFDVITAAADPIPFSDTVETDHKPAIAERSPNGSYLLAVSKLDKKLEIRDAKTGTLLHSMEWPNGVSSAIFSPDSTFLLIIDEDPAKAQILDVLSGRIVHEIQHNGWIVDFGFNLESRFVFTASTDQTVHITRIKRLHLD